MENTEIKLVETRLGPREIRLDRVVGFPHGLIGFEHLREFSLLQVWEDAPLLLLQSMEEPELGLLVADPFSFIPDYKLSIGSAEQQTLQASDAGHLAVLVTASIPPGKPEETFLNLLGPILINHRARIGLQVPQPEDSGPAHYYVYKQSQ